VRTRLSFLSSHLDSASELRRLVEPQPQGAAKRRVKVRRATVGDRLSSPGRGSGQSSVEMRERLRNCERG